MRRVVQRSASEADKSAPSRRSRAQLPTSAVCLAAAHPAGREASLGARNGCMRSTEDTAMMISTKEILNLLRAKPGRFVLDIAADELPIKEGDDTDVVMFVNGAYYPVRARIAQMRDLEKQGCVVTQPGRWVLSAELPPLASG